MKKKKDKLFVSLSVLLIVFLISSSSINTINTQALVEEKQDQYYTNSFDQSTWRWSTTKVVSTESTEDSFIPSLAVDTLGNAHISWHDETDYAGSGTDWDIFYKRWNPTSSSWTTTEIVSTGSAGISAFPSLAVDTFGNVHIVWRDSTDYAGAGTDEDIFYKRWDASISSWTTPEVVSTESTEHSLTPSLAVDTLGNVHIAWWDLTDYDILYKQWNASSSSWTSTEVVSTESTDDSSSPSLAVDSTGNVHIAWVDYTDYASAGTDLDIFYKRWNSSSSSWTTTEVVSTDNIDDSSSPSLAVDSTGNVHIVWYDWTDYAGSGTDPDIFYKRWDVATSTWTTTEVVSTESTAGSSSPSLAVDSAGNIHVIWEDSTDYTGVGTDHDVFYKRWDSFSSSWTITEVVSTESTSNSNSPSLAVNSVGSVHIAWYDYTDYAGSGTDPDIFYKLLTALPPPAPELAFIIPTLTEPDAIYLDWNDVLVANTYYVYRSTSYIWSIEELVPITTVSSSEYIDTVLSEGFYYYVVIAENFVGNSSISNCQYIEVKFPDLEAPELATILPNPTDITSVSLVWNEIIGVTDYYIYRSDSYIWSVESLTPIDTVSTNSYVDSLPAEGYYFYVIVATDGVRNSTHSNCEYVEYKLPTLNEFVAISSLIVGSFVTIYAILQYRRKAKKN